MTDDEAAKKARNAAKRKNEKYTRPVSKYPTFENHEVKEGHAIKIEEEKINKEGAKVMKTKYLWYDIDIERDDDEYDDEEDDEEEHEEEHSTNFDFYAKSICRKEQKAMIEEGYEDYDKIRVSKPMAKFFSNLAIDFIARMSPLITELITFKGSSTITDEVVKVALRALLIDSRPEVDGTNKLTDEHEELMNLIDSKVRLITDHQTKTKPAQSDASEATDATDASVPAEEQLDEEENEEEIVDPPPKPAVVIRRRRPAAKK